VIELRAATADDVDWLAELYSGDDVDPFLSPRAPRDRAALLDAIESLLVIEVDGERAGALSYREVSDANRTAHLGALAVHPDFRGRRVADEAARLAQRYLLLELGYHRLELACYGFNERAIAHAERAGWIREGVKRKAYLRHGEWQDAVQFALLREDLDP
jgi:putative acetyltransferase